MNKYFKNKKAFTIIELIVIMAVLAIFVAMGIPRMSGFTKEASMTKLLNDAKVIEDAAHRYYLQYGEWPRAEREMTPEEVNAFTDKVLDVTGKVITLEPEGKYYDIDMMKLVGFVSVKSDAYNFIIQNPVGSVYILNPENNKALGEGFTIKEKPIAIISMTPELILTTNTQITWNYDLSTSQNEYTIIDAEWENKQDMYTTEGEHTVKLRVKSSNGLWSDWVERSFSVVDAKGIKEIVAGSSHALMLLNDGTVYSWGSNSYGQLGFGYFSGKTTAPTKIPNLEDVIGISAGSASSMALLSDGTVKCWGSYTGTGAVGGGHTTSHSPITNPHLTDIKAIESGWGVNFAITNSGDAYGWGSGGDYTPIGITSTSNGSYTPAKVNISNVKQVSTDSRHALFLLNDGTVKACGYRRATGIGGSATYIGLPVQVPGLSNVKEVSTGYNSSIAILNDGTVKLFGENSYACFGLESRIDPPTTIPGLSNVVSADIGKIHFNVVLGDGTMKGWGTNDVGQLGIGNTTLRQNLVSVPNTPGITNAKKVVSGENFTLIIKTDGTLWGTGNNTSGQLGIGNTTNQSLFKKITF